MPNNPHENQKIIPEKCGVIFQKMSTPDFMPILCPRLGTCAVLVRYGWPQSFKE
jgi:hypothetical protein